MRIIDFDFKCLPAASHENEEKMEEFNLTEEDLLSGYYIYNPDEGTSVYTLTPDTTYNFIDWNRDFTDSDDTGIVSISTTSIDDFIKYLNTYTDARLGMPFFFELDGNNVISITERPMA